jgi:hypothetical protein
MDFNKLLAKMGELDKPISECGEMMVPPMSPSMMPPTGAQSTPPIAPPNMTLNLNAQGMDNIENLMKLFTKVNPDMINQPADSSPTLALPPAVGGMKPAGMSPLKMLPDFDADNDDMPGGDNDFDLTDIDLDSDGDHDMDDHEMEPDDSDDFGIDIDLDSDDLDSDDMDSDDMDSDDGMGRRGKEEGFGNSVAGDEGPEEYEMDAAIRDGNDLHKSKRMYKHSYRHGDNPMAMEGAELRAAIRKELLQRLAEAKGAK